VAAALFYQQSANARAHQGGLAGWRNAGSAPWRYSLRHTEQTYAIELQVLSDGQQPRLLAHLTDQQIELQLLACDGRWASLELDGIRQRMAYHLDADRLWLYGHNGNLEFSDVTQQPASEAASAASGNVKAPMDGAIVEVLVEEGSRVSKGQLLLVLEAMKMEHPLKASIDGLVRRVGVNRGDQVKNRQLLVEIEVAES
jgi:geranyl-CoA carboxylase alpha subunit